MPKHKLAKQELPVYRSVQKLPEDVATFTRALSSNDPVATGLLPSVRRCHAHRVNRPGARECPVSSRCSVPSFSDHHTRAVLSSDFVTACLPSGVTHTRVHHPGACAR